MGASRKLRPALLDLDGTGLDRQAVEDAEFAALRRYQTAKTFDSVQWNFLVETWNEAQTQERQKRHRYCLRNRHDWVGLPMDGGAKVCRRCVAYKVESPG